jgi:hypothetical protein
MEAIERHHLTIALVRLGGGDIVRHPPVGADMLTVL